MNTVFSLKDWGLLVASAGAVVGLIGAMLKKHRGASTVLMTLGGALVFVGATFPEFKGAGISYILVFAGLLCMILPVIFVKLPKQLAGAGLFLSLMGLFVHLWL